MKIRLSINKKVVNKNENHANLGYVDGYYEISVKDFINKVIRKGYAWMPPRLKDNAVKKINFIRSEIIGIDIDDGWTLQDAFNDKFTQENALLIYTSHSHSAKKHKFRILFKLLEPVTDLHKFENTVKQLIVYYKADKQCSNANRWFYGNTQAKVKVFGNIYYDNRYVPEKTEEEIPRTIEYFLKSRKTLEDMLATIQTKHKRLEYDKWLTLCSSIWSCFTFEESIDLILKYSVKYPDATKATYKYKYEHRLTTIPYTYIIKFAIKCGFKPELNQYPDFVRVNSKGEMLTPPVGIVDFLTQRKYFTFFYNPGDNLNYQIIKEEQNILQETGKKRICEYLQDHVKKNYSEGDATFLRSHLMGVKMNKVFEFLHSPDIPIHKDTKSKSYFYFKNGFLEVNENKTIFHESYKDLGEYKLWGNLVKPVEYTINNEPCEFEGFLYKVSNKNKERFDILRSVIGYLLHRYKDPHVTKAVVLNDENIDIDNPSGRTGKSLIAQAISYARNVLTIDAKVFDVKERFCWQNVTLSTEIINMDDIPKKFNLKPFYSILTGSMKVEEKGEKALILPFNISPKLVLTSNYTVNTSGASSRARVVEIALHNYYSDSFQPVHEYGHRFFEDWDTIEWNRFYTFMAGCVQQYFKVGMLHTVSDKLIRNKSVNETTEVFTSWIQTIEFYQDDKQFFTQKELFDSYIAYVKDDADSEPLTSNQFHKYVRTYFSICEIPYKKECIRIDEVPTWVYTIKIR